VAQGRGTTCTDHKAHATVWDGPEDGTKGTEYENKKVDRKLAGREKSLLWTEKQLNTSKKRRQENREANYFERKLGKGGEHGEGRRKRVGSVEGLKMF